MPVTGAEIRATGVLLGFFVVTMALAVLLAAPSLRSGLQQFEDPEDPANVAWYIGLILAFTFLILWIAKRGWKWAIRLLILVAVGSSIIFVAYPLLAQTAGMSPEAAMGVSVLAAAAVTVALWKHPEWYVIDTAGILVAAGAASVFGISFVPWLVVLLLTLLAIYDAIAVYRTKHMLSLADTVIELRLPVLLVIPKHGGYRFRADAARMKQATQTNKAEREAMFMGLGDLVMPTILVVSALVFLPAASDLPLDLRVDVDGTRPADPDAPSPPFTLTTTVLGEGETVRLRYDLASTDQAAAGWAWSLDHDLDAQSDANGTGLPASVEASYDEAQAITVHAVAGPGGGSELRQDVAIEEPAGPWHTALVKLLHNKAALGAALGTIAGYLVLMTFVLKGNPQAGLPLLNGGAILGFLVGLWAATGSLAFW